MSTSSVKIDAFSSARFLDHVQDQLGRSMDRLGSGSKIISPSDDPKGVALSEKITAQNKRIGAATTNVQNAVSYLQTADGFVGTMNGLVMRMSELTTLAKDPTKNPSDVALYQSEFTELQDQLRATIGGSTAEIGGTSGISQPAGTFNGNVLFGANPGGIPIATSENASENVALPETNLRDGSMLELIRQDSSGNYTMHLTDSDAGDKINAGLQDLSDERSTLAAVSGRFDKIAVNLTARGENLTRTLSTINDVNVATESTHLAKFQMMAQAATSMLAQANQSPRSVLRLLGTVAPTTP